jgi:hypothetical protein
LNELSTQLLRKLDRLVLDGQASQDKCIGADIAAGSTAVAVRDLPGAAGGLLEGRALRRVEDGVAGGGGGGFDGRGELGAPDPEVCGAGVEVEF